MPFFFTDSDSTLTSVAKRSNRKMEKSIELTFHFETLDDTTSGLVSRPLGISSEILPDPIMFLQKVFFFGFSVEEPHSTIMKIILKNNGWFHVEHLRFGEKVVIY